MTVRTLLLNGVALTVHESANLSQDYEQETATDFRRTADGSLKRRSLGYTKLQTSITGRGLMPSGLAVFDFSVPYTLSCIAHRSVTSTSNIITLPVARRSDAGAEPYALWTNGGDWGVAEIAGVSVDEYTLTVVPAATSYKLYYFPEVSVMSEPPTESHAPGALAFGWQLTAREV